VLRFTDRQPVYDEAQLVVERAVSLLSGGDRTASSIR
jgi:hypothetical protein